MDSLYGILFSQWMKMLIKNNFNISFKALPQIIVITFFSIRNSFYAKTDKKIAEKIYSSTKLVKDPVFILGHWRSGTTFLHNILALDNNFAYPRIFQVIHPSTFIYLNKKFQNFIQSRATKKRRMDNVKHHPMSPGEEEFAMAAITLKSPIVGWVFPSKYEYYEKYLCLKDIPKADLKEWEIEYARYLKKVTYLEKKQLILKSPTNTARIKFLLKLYPNAKFIHIHRNPFNVFLSTKKLHQTAIAKTSFQKISYDINEKILNTYETLYKCFFDDKKLLDKNNFVDISFEDLETNTMETIKRIYETVDIGDFQNLKPALEKYLEENRNYKKNEYPPIEENLKKKIYDRWKKYFDYWGYKYN